MAYVTGWKCPECKTLYSPFVQLCKPCSPGNFRLLITSNMPPEKRTRLIDALKQALLPDEVA